MKWNCALDHGLSGAVDSPSSYFFKSPPTQYTDYEAREKTEAYIKKYAQKPAKDKK